MTWPKFVLAVYIAWWLFVVVLGIVSVLRP